MAIPKSNRVHDEGRLPKWAQRRLEVAREQARFIRLTATRFLKLTPVGADSPGQDINMVSGDTVQFDMSALTRMREAVQDIAFMARRYADGRATYAPSVYNRSVRTLQALGVQLDPGADGTIWARDGGGRRFDHLTEQEAQSTLPTTEAGRLRSYIESVESVLKYAEHTPYCNLRLADPEAIRCTCGLTAALTRLRSS